MENAPTPIDGIGPTQPVLSAQNASDDKQVRRWKTLITGAVGVCYVAYMLWCSILLLLLPSVSSSASLLTTIGLISCLIGAGVIVLISLLSVLHIARTPATTQARKFALIKLSVIVVPGMLLSAITPFMILQEPAYSIDITSPTSTNSLIAPISLSFSADTTKQALAQRGFLPLRYRWDINGDGKMDSETFDPAITASYDRAGVFVVGLTMVSSNGETRSARRRVIIEQAVFSISPVIPLVNMPVVFDLSNLTTKDISIVTADWDFESDGTVDETANGPQASNTYFRTGPINVSVQVNFSNNTQVTYRRSIDIQNPPPLPYPVQIISDPKYLVSTAPFTVLFSLDTKEEIANVQWQFGDGGKAEGAHIAHTFTRNGSYTVQAKVRSASGTLADVSTSVSIVERLDLSDLRFEGTPTVTGTKIVGEVPLTLSLKPITSKPFVTFMWEAPGATDIGMTEESLQAIYRREGTYIVTLIGKDAENRVLRLPITIEVRPPSAVLSFQMDPESGVAPLSVRFDASESSIPSDDIIGFIWGFGDSSPKEYGGAYTEHIFPAAGTYVIDLTVRTVSGKQLTSTRTLVVRAPLIQACILPSRLSGPTPFGVDLSSDCSAGTIKQVLWDFGDGSQSDQRNPVHVFMNPGTYTVRLTITDSGGATHSTTVSLTAQ